MVMGTLRKHRGEAVTLATTVGFPQVRGIPRGMNVLEIEVPSATKENISYALTPRIKKVWFYDASTGRYHDVTEELTDRNTATGTGALLNAMQTDDYLIVGCTRRIRGLAVDVANTNTTGASNGAVDYLVAGDVWKAVTTLSDGTDSTDTLRQDGVITWDVPTDQSPVEFNNSGEKLFWYRYSTLTAFTDTSVSIVELVALADVTINVADSSNEGTDYALIQSNAQTLPPYVIPIELSTFGGIELKSTSITSAANLVWKEIH